MTDGNTYRYSKINLLILFITGIFLSACKKDNTESLLPKTDKKPTPIELQVPENFPEPVIMPENPLTAEGVALGRKLFYDADLSANLKVSCASCHQQKLAFSDGINLANHGVSGNTLHRHSPALVNMAWMNNGFFWDGGSKNLESQALGPLTHADEMGMSLAGVLERIKANIEYEPLFFAAFENGIKIENVAKALAQFQRTLISANSKYDKYVRKENGAVLTDKELKGMNLVKKHCGSCHSGILFTDNGFHNNGIDNDFSDDSHEWIYRGRYRITFNTEDLGAFKTPTLRNVMITAPYMHDGRFSTIEDVLNHYQKGIKTAIHTSPLLYQNNGHAGIPITETDKSDIIAFLHTLTDEQFLNNSNFSKP